MLTVKVESVVNGFGKIIVTRLGSRNVYQGFTIRIDTFGERWGVLIVFKEIVRSSHASSLFTKTYI